MKGGRRTFGMLRILLLGVFAVLAVDYLARDPTVRHPSSFPVTPILLAVLGGVLLFILLWKLTGTK